MLFTCIAVVIEFHLTGLVLYVRLRVAVRKCFCASELLRKG